jgi:hypothetical protein
MSTEVSLEIVNISHEFVIFLRWFSSTISLQ